MDLYAREVRKKGLKIRLQDQPFKILVALVFRAEELVTREELYSKLSSHNNYDFKHGLNTAIQKIRKALDDSSQTPRFIETVADRGYRFLLPVEFIADISATANGRICLDKDVFLSSVLEIRKEF